MKKLEDTRPIRYFKAETFKGTGGFTYIDVPWIISNEDEGKDVEFEGRTFYPVTGDMMSQRTTFILKSDLQAWRKWSRD